jgi:hypothetical protein
MLAHIVGNGRKVAFPWNSITGAKLFDSLSPSKPHNAETEGAHHGLSIPQEHQDIAGHPF